jgi:carbonic anhydrase
MSPILAEMEVAGEIAIKGGVYQLATGAVAWL